MTLPDGRKLAVLIDADNIAPSVLKQLLQEVAGFGTALVRRAYGDWTTQRLSGWKNQLHRHAIQPVQQFSFTSGKNATDAALIIDAMDILHLGSVDGFCLVSSDSDFTRLATRLREAGKVVYGLGERKTPESFRSACNRFVFLDVAKQPPAIAKGKPPVAQICSLREQLIQAIAVVSGDSGWSTLTALGNQLARNNPPFSAKLHGFSKLGDLVRQQPYLEVVDAADETVSTQPRVRIRQAVHHITSRKVRVQAG